MQLEIVGKKGRVLRSIAHNGQIYAEAPKGGEYQIRLRNTSAFRRLAVVSVDGVNVLDGKDAGFDGQGYVLRPWETIDIPGWRRSDNTVAKFEFREQGGSYAAQTGRGTSNVGVVGVAVFDERINLFNNITFTTFQNTTPLQPFGTIYTHNTAPTASHPGANILRGGRTKSMSDKEEYTSGNIRMRSMKSDDSTMDSFVGDASSASVMGFDSEPAPAPVKDVGTAYGREAAFHTASTTFNRATTTPALVLSVRYATKERLKSWGVPIEEVAEAPKAPSPFPMSMPSVPAPAGWRP